MHVYCYLFLSLDFSDITLIPSVYILYWRQVSYKIQISH